MLKKMLCASCVMVLVGAGTGIHSTAMAQEANDVLRGQPVAASNPADGAESSFDTLPPGQPTYQHYYSMATGVLTDVPPPEPSVAGTMTPIKVYSNTPEPTFTFRTLGKEIGDDIISIAVGGCDVSMYQIQMARSVLGCTNNGSPCDNDNQCFGANTCNVRPDPGFSTTVALYDACPGDGGQLIAGTGATIAVAEDGIHTITVDLSGTPIFVDSSFWIILTTDKPQAGITVGGPASTGFTNNVHHVDPGIPCRAAFTGTPIYAGYHVEVYCVGQFDREYLAYFNPAKAGSDGLFSPGANNWLADDITLIEGAVAPTCTLTSYEITSQANGGPFGLESQLWRFCSETSLIAGSEGSFTGLGNGTPEIARFDFPTSGPGAINLTVDNFWVAWRYDTARGTAFISEEAVLGTNGDVFGLPPMGCNFFFGGDPYAGFAVNVRCLGDAPVGACCNITPLLTGPSTNLCVETPEIGCTGISPTPLKRWAFGATCDDPTGFDPDPPCGQAACCEPPQGGNQQICNNAAKDDCLALTDNEGNPAQWSIGQFCGQAGQTCFPWTCVHPTAGGGSCDQTHPGAGCDNAACCAAVCGLSSSLAQDCCNPNIPNEALGWENLCVNFASDLAQCMGAPFNDNCADAAVIDLTPRCTNTGTACVTNANCSGGANCIHPRITIDNTSATPEADDGFCCHPGGNGLKGSGSVWFSFVADETSALLDTCLSGADDSLMEVYEVADDSSPTAMCETKSPISCSDEGPCSGINQSHSKMCVSGLQVGATYLVQLAAKSTATRGAYTLRIETPCSGGPAPPASSCNLATSVSGVTVNAPYDLTDAAFSCPPPTCLDGMETDVWFDYFSVGNGILTVETCQPDGGSDPDTTLVAYTGSDCPATVQRRIGCNDDVPKDCTVSGTSCDTDADCNACDGNGNAAGRACLSDPDCRTCAISALSCFDVGDCKKCSNTGLPCSSSSQCKGCNISNTPCVDNLDCPAGESCTTASCQNAPGESCDQDGACIVSGETCDNVHDGAFCGPGSIMTFGVAQNEDYLIRLGGKNGSEPMGTLSITFEPDCNQNTRPDDEDMACGLGNVCDGIPGSANCNNNIRPDECDIEQFGFPDCDENLAIDTCQIADDPSLDLNINGVLDTCEGCQDGAVTFSDPTHDAGQTNEVGDATQQGRQVFTVVAPVDADADAGACWTTCQTADGGLGANSVTSVVNVGGSMYEVTLDRGITPGAITRLTYDNTASGGATTVVGGFTYMPADTNNDGTSMPSDVVAAAGSIDGSAPLPSSQVDANRDGEQTPADLLRILDLLLGGDGYDQWFGQSIVSPGCP